MEAFKERLETHFQDFLKTTTAPNGDWTVKGFIDIYSNIYTISIDTKVISKIIELMIFPSLVQFALENGYDMILSKHQNHYPDITFRDFQSNEYFALDLKSTYRLNAKRVNGMRLGAFTGYFRNRESDKNITIPYSRYTKHYVLGCIYDQVIDIDERQIYRLDELLSIASAIKNIHFFVQEKWKIAVDRPGSGNTKNIGSETDITYLTQGKGLFTRYHNGEKLFDKYWVNYMTQDMAKSVDLPKSPYNNLTTFFQHFENEKEYELLT